MAYKSHYIPQQHANLTACGELVVSPGRKRRLPATTRREYVTCQKCQRKL